MRIGWQLLVIMLVVMVGVMFAAFGTRCQAQNMDLTINPHQVSAAWRSCDDSERLWTDYCWSKQKPTSDIQFAPHPRNVHAPLEAACERPHCAPHSHFSSLSDWLPKWKKSAGIGRPHAFSNGVFGSHLRGQRGGSCQDCTQFQPTYAGSRSEHSEGSPDEDQGFDPERRPADPGAANSGADMDGELAIPPAPPDRGPPSLDLDMPLLPPADNP